MENARELIRRLTERTDDELFQKLEDNIIGERAHLADILAILGILDARRAAVPRGSSSIYTYCTSRLGYCERTAYRRVAAARACSRCPEILDRLRSGKVHLTAIVLLADYFTQENHAALLAKAEGATLDVLKRLAASLSPVAAAPRERTRVIAVVEKGRLFGGLETSPAAGGQSELSPSSSPTVTYRIEHQFTLGDAAEAKLMRARELLAHKYPMGDLESIFEAALDSLLDAVDPSRRKARADAVPRPFADQTRRIPEWVRRKVRERDEDRCAFVSSEGARCGERRFLQFDHIVPWSLGGRSDDPGNIRQLCAAHNRWAWRHAFVTRS